MRDTLKTGFADRLKAQAEAKKAQLAKFKPKPTVQAEDFESREAVRARELEVVRQARAEAKEAARLAALEAQEAARLAALFMAFVTAGAIRSRSRSWRISAVVVWIALFVVLGFLADRLGLRLP